MWIDESAPISLEVAKLLGVPFGTSASTQVLFRFKHTGKGLVLQAMWLDMTRKWKNTSLHVDGSHLFPGLTLYRAREKGETDVDR